LDNPAVTVKVSYERIGDYRLTGNVHISLHNSDTSAQIIAVLDNAYGKAASNLLLPPASHREIVLDLSGSYGWYNFSITVKGRQGFEERFAGRVETGREGRTDPLMGGVV
jgi:phospholipase C